MNKVVKKPNKSNLKLANKNISPKNVNVKVQKLNNVQGLIAATSEKIEKEEHHVKVTEGKSDGFLRKTLILDGLC